MAQKTTTLHEMIYHVKNLFRGGRGNDNDPITLLQYGRIIDQARAEVLRENWKKFRYDHTLLEQDPGVLQLLPLELQQNTVAGSDVQLEDRNVNTHNADFFFYRNMWTIEIPELIGLSGHMDLRIGTGVDDVFTVPIVDHDAMRWYRHLKFSGSQEKYCWSQGLTKVTPHLNKLVVETGNIHDTALAAKVAGAQNYILAEHDEVVLVDEYNGETESIYQPFLRIHGIFARPTAVSGWSETDPLNLEESAKVMRYPITEVLKEQVIEHITKYYLGTMETFFTDRANNAIQEEDRLDTLSNASAGAMPRGRRR